MSETECEDSESENPARMPRVCVNHRAQAFHTLKSAYHIELNQRRRKKAHRNSVKRTFVIGTLWTVVELVCTYIRFLILRLVYMKRVRCINHEVSQLKASDSYSFERSWLILDFIICHTSNTHTLPAVSPYMRQQQYQASRRVRTKGPQGSPAGCGER